MMRYIISFIKQILVVLSRIISYKVLDVIVDIRSDAYSAIIKRSFKRCGKNFNIGYPSKFYGYDAIEIGDNFSSFSRLRLEAFKCHNQVSFNPQLIIGNNVSINYDCHIGCANKIIIEDNVLIGSKVLITDHSHGTIDSPALLLPPSKRTLYSKGPVIIKENVWIGEGVAILPNVTIGKNAIIGANSVVTKDVPPNSIIAGNPAKIVKILK